MQTPKLPITLLIGFLLFSSCRSDVAPSVDERPNILLIVADDLGYGDLGVYGGDIRTPNIDALAKSGLLFTQFHTAPLCALTRAMLLSGNNHHVAGMARQGRPEDTPVVYVPGYEGHLSDRIMPLPRLLNEAGYHTLTVGKWHLGTEPQHGPKAAGFERSFNLLDGAGNHFNAVGMRERGSLYAEDGEPEEWPEGRYSTALYTDRLIEFIDDTRDGKPFFAFAAYTSPHWPLQVPESELDRYAGQYDQGYDRLREERFASLKAAGILPAHHELPPRLETITPWENVPPDERRRESRKMELYAAMVENLDHHVGRLIDHLEARDLLENTLIVFMSDNGAAAEDFYYEGRYAEHIQKHHDNAYENMGKPGSWVSYGPQWAEAGSAAFNRHKGFATEGGIVAPMIVAGYGIKESGARTAAYATVMDLAPSFLELAGAEYPSDGSVRPMRGETMLPLLAGTARDVHSEDYVTILSHRGRTALRQGQWKLTHIEREFREEDFGLYDLQADPGETINLSDTHPERMELLLELWRAQRKALGILLPGDL